ncbi:MAG: GSCFA domain-containing protein [Parvularculaceae bacterium]
MKQSDNPYKLLPDRNFWRRCLSSKSPHEVDPVADTKFKISPDMRVATAGSCFAQHIARILSRSSFNYFVPEDGSNLTPAERDRRGYGVFSARFGNIYTVRQLRQLIDEAYGVRSPQHSPWLRPDNRLADPLRPSIEPDGFAGEAEYRESRDTHLEAVRRMIEQANVFVFTLGLTECWRSRRDGTVYPLVPGAVAGQYDPDEHEFYNFKTQEVIEDLAAVMKRLKERNHALKSILTVSPVPLIATYENRHVLTSTTYSKSVLRAAAGEIADSADWIDYFPSYEIITGNFNQGRYYEDDLRQVNPIGVGHAMRMFMKHYAVTDNGEPASPGRVARAGIDQDEVICDEETLDVVKSD